MSNVADDDTLHGFVQLWLDTPALVVLVPDGPRAGRLPSQQPDLYCGIACEQGPNPNEYFAPVGVGAPYLDYRTVTFTARGLKDDVVGLMNEIRHVYGWKEQNITVPNADVLAIAPADEGKLTLDDSVKEGEDIWIGTLTYHVTATRTVV